MHKYMSCQFINFMSMSITAARELNNPVLETLLSDYAKHRTKSKFQYLFIHLLANKYKTNMNMSSDMKLQYLLIKYYIKKNKVNLTRELIFDEDINIDF